MDWKTASSYYETRLTDALNIQRHAVNLANLPQAEVPEKLKQTVPTPDKCSTVGPPIKTSSHTTPVGGVPGS
jgi:hypothetical protein